MHKILAAIIAAATCVQPLQTNAETANSIPSGAALEQSLLGKRVAPDSGPGGRSTTFLKDGVMKQERKGLPDQMLNWFVKDQSLCIKDGQDNPCFNVIELNDQQLTIRSSNPEHGNRTSTMLFLNEDGVPLRDVVDYDGKLARSLFGHVITVEEVDPPESLKGSKTVLDFNSKETVALQVLNASGQPALGGIMAADLPYKSTGDTLCLVTDQQKTRCMLVEISGKNIRLIPLKKGARVEEDTMVGFIE